MGGIGGKLESQQDDSLSEGLQNSLSQVPVMEDLFSQTCPGFCEISAFIFELLIRPSFTSYFVRIT